MSSPPDWLQFYQRNSSFTTTTTTTTTDHDDHHHQPRVHPVQGLSSNMLGRASSVADATVVTTTVTASSSSNIFGSSLPTSTGIIQMNGASSSSNSAISGSNNSSSSHLNPERRVSKPIRRRRASRGTPITLLNTDTHNFRAMVQQFTGVPNAPFSLVSQSTSTGATNLNFELARHRFHQDPSSFMMQQQQQQQQQQLQQQLQRQQFMFSLNNNCDSTTSTGGDAASHHHHHQELIINNLRLPNMEQDSNGFLMQSSISPNVFHGSSSN